MSENLPMLWNPDGDPPCNRRTEDRRIADFLVAVDRRQGPRRFDDQEQMSEPFDVGEERALHFAEMCIKDGDRA